MSDNPRPAILYVYGGKFGLPSIDPKCLQLLFYLRLHPNHNIVIKIPDCWASPLLPALRYMDKLTIEFDEILEMLTELVKPACDENFEEETRRRLNKYKNVNYRVLEGPFLLNFWGYKKNLDYFGDLYSGTMHPGLHDTFRKTVRIYHMEQVLNILDDHSFTDCVILGNHAVDRYFNFVSILLGNKKYMFGDSPSSYDAHLCGYLAPLMICNFPNNQIKRILSTHTNLVNYVDNYVETYGDRRHDASDVDDFGKDLPHNNRKIWRFIMCVLVMVIGFGVYKFRSG